MSQNGKGSSPRPVDKEKFDNNWDAIDWGRNKKQLHEQTTRVINKPKPKTDNK